MAEKQKQTDNPNRTLRAKKSFIISSILICIFAAAFVIGGACWTANRSAKTYHAEKTLSALKTAAYSAENADSGSDDVFVKNKARQEEPEAQNNQHGVVLDDRKNLKMTGVTEVDTFSDNKIALGTNLGQLIITGRYLHILRFNTKTHELSVKGTIDSLVYSNKNRNIGSYFERINDSLRTFLNREVKIAQ